MLNDLEAISRNYRLATGLDQPEDYIPEPEPPAAEASPELASGLDQPEDYIPDPEPPVAEASHELYDSEGA